PYADPLLQFVNWYCQLWAESLGKRVANADPAGTLPVRAMGSVDQHSQLQMYLESRADKMFTFLVLDHWENDHAIALPDADRPAFPYLAGKRLSEVLDAEFRATREVITRAGHPNVTLHLPTLDAHVLGQLIDLYQRVTIYTGLLYGINPLDQPAVELGKQLTLRYLSEAAPG
ncbi:MAG: glucose-6-phosphate isomerase, partial [Pseudomonadota bacterium]